MSQTTTPQYTFKDEVEMYNYALSKGWGKPLKDLISYSAKMSRKLEKSKQESMRAQFDFSPSKYGLKDEDSFLEWVSNIVLSDYSEEKLFPNFSIN